MFCQLSVVSCQLSVISCELLIGGYLLSLMALTLLERGRADY